MYRSTKHSFHVVYQDGRPMIDHDFIEHSRRYYYYQSNIKISDHAYEGCLTTFDRWRQEVLDGREDFSWDQFTKLPYLYQDLSHRPQLKFPIIIYDGGMRCGLGRCFMVKKFYPHIAVDAIEIMDAPSDTGNRLRSVGDLENILLAKSPAFQHLTDQHIWTFHVVDDIITATDCSADPNNRFPFCKDSEKNTGLLSRIKEFVMDNAAMDIETLLSTVSQFDIK